MFNPIFAMLYNTKLERWHPILFVERPLPGPYSPDKPVRHKSHGHHTEGFATREEALASIDEYTKRPGLEGCRLELDADMEWDGEDMPAMVMFFGEAPAHR